MSLNINEEAMISDLLSSLRRYDDAKINHDRGARECEHDWSYWGRHEIEALEESGEEFAKSLNKLIDARIERRLDIFRRAYAIGED